MSKELRRVCPMDYCRVSAGFPSALIALAGSFFIGGCAATDQQIDAGAGARVDQKTAAVMAEMEADFRAELSALRSELKVSPEQSSGTSVLSGWAKTTQVSIVGTGTATIVVMLILLGNHLERRMTHRERMAVIPLLNVEENTKNDI